MQTLFRQQGFPLTAVEAGKQGIKAVEAVRFNLVIADYRLPDMDGVAFFIRVQEIEPGMAKLLMTTGEVEELAHARKVLGNLGIVKKPFTKSEFVKGLSQASWCEKKRPFS